MYVSIYIYVYIPIYSTYNTYKKYKKYILFMYIKVKEPRVLVSFLLSL